MKTLLIVGTTGVLAVGATLAAVLFLGSDSPEDADPPFKPGAYKILVPEDGFYRVSLDDLEQANALATDLPPPQMHLSTGGHSVHYLVDGADLIFYGRSSDSRYSALRPYILDLGRSGPQMEAISHLPADVSTPAVPYRLRLEQNLAYDSRARLLDFGASATDEPWFWATVQTGDRFPVEFSLPDSVNGTASVQIHLWGATHSGEIDPDHDFELVVNDHNVATARWDGEEYFTGDFELPAGVLKPGANTIVLDNSGQGSGLLDIFKLDWIELAVGARPVAVDGRVEFSGVTGNVAIAGFDDKPLLFDISDPDRPAVLDGWGFHDGTANVGVSDEMHIVAVNSNALPSPEKIQPLRQSDLRNQHNQADLLIIAADELVETLRPLVDVREKQGLSVATVSAEEIYDEFGLGEPSPDSITAFLRFAFEHWTGPKPRYLLLVGDATYDYRAYLGEVPPNQVPPPLIPVTFGGETVSDGRLADVDGDKIPDLAVGRWPVSDPEVLARLVDRTLVYEAGIAKSSAIFAADGTSVEFSSLSDRLLASSDLPEEYVDRLYGQPQEAFANAWNNGAWLVSYAGHGSLDRWGKDDVLSIDNVAALKSAGAPPIVLQLTCLTGFFAHPTATSISEQMLLHPEGPVLLVAATSLTLSTSQEPFGINFLQELQDPGVVRIGDAFLQAKLALDFTNPLQQEVSDTFGLLGDPSALIVRPGPGREEVDSR